MPSLNSENDVNLYQVTADRELEHWTNWYRDAVGFGDPSRCIVQPCCARKDGPLCPQCSDIVNGARAKIRADKDMAELAGLTCDHGIAVNTYCADCPPPFPGATVTGMPDPFVRLRRGDDWGSIYFALEPKNDRGFCDHRRGIVTFGSDDVEVRWPTGDITNESIVMVEQRQQVDDHGHSTVVASAIPCVRSVLHGKMGDVIVDTPLDQLDVRESWVTARLRRG
jgi:hypothetical protein